MNTPLDNPSTRIQVEVNGQLREGLYFVRLTQGARVATSRVTILGSR